MKVAAAYHWVNAVNAEGSFGVWRYAVARRPNEVPQKIDEIATRSVDQPDGDPVPTRG